MSIADSETWQQQARQYVQQFLGNRGWQLVSESGQFEEKCLSSISLLEAQAWGRDEIERVVRRETTRLYSIVIYEAVQMEGTRRQRRAFQELWDYLLPVALYRTRDEEQAQEYTQRTLLKIWEKWRQCKDPDRFLGWARVILLNEIRMAARKRKRHPTSPWDGLSRQERENAWEQTIAGGEGKQQRPSERRIASHESIQRLRQALEAALRSDQQRSVIEGLFIEGLGFKAVAERLDTTPSNVYTLKSRALSRLREDEVFQRTLEDLVR